MQRLLPLAVVLGLAAAPAVAESFEWSGTGPNGGTAAGAGSCSVDDGTRTCTRGGTYTSPVGRVFGAETTAVRSRGAVQRTTTGTGPNGGTFVGQADCTAGGGSIGCGRSRVHTSPAGQSYTVDSQATRSRDGGTRTTTRTGPGGRTGTVTVERSR